MSDGLPSWYDRWRTSYPEPEEPIRYECVDCHEEFKKPMPECPICRGQVREVWPEEPYP